MRNKNNIKKHPQVPSSQVNDPVLDIVLEYTERELKNPDYL